MDPNQVVSNQLPDENKIKQMFPKCPPTTPNKKTFSNSAKKTRRKVQLHSRKVLEDRRNRIRATKQQQQQQHQQQQEQDPHYQTQQPRQQQPQQPQQQQQQQPTTLEKRSTRRNSRSKSSDSSDDTASGRSQQTNTKAINNNNCTKKNGYASKQHTKLSNSTPQNFLQSSSARLDSQANLSNELIQPSKEHDVIELEQEKTTYAPSPPSVPDQNQPLSQEAVNSHLSFNLIDNDSFIAGDEQNIQSLNIKTDTINVVTGNNSVNNISVDIEEILSNNDCDEARLVSDHATTTKQLTTENKSTADDLDKERREERQETTDSERLEYNQQQLQPSVSALPKDIEQQSVKIDEQSMVQDGDKNDLSNNLDTSKLTVINDQQDNIISDANEDERDRFSLPQIHTSSNDSANEYISHNSVLLTNSNAAGTTENIITSNIIDLSPPRLTSNLHPLKTLLESDEDGIEQTNVGQMSNLNNLELLNSNPSQYTLGTNETVVIANSSDIELIQPKSPTIRLLETFSEVDEDNDPDRSISTRVPNLRHHKLPNESSHYSIVRVNSSNIDDTVAVVTNHSNLPGRSSLPTQLSTLPEENDTTLKKLSDIRQRISDVRSDRLITGSCSNQSIARPNLNTIAADNNEAASNPPRSSSLQFNNLSDAEESESEIAPNRCSGYDRSIRSAIHMTSIPAKKCDLSSPTNHINDHLIQNNNKKLHLDDESTPITKTALIFPCLDEGLSSAAESCDDDADDDDERAVDADVDADDDDEDDDADADEDGDEDAIDRDLAALQLNQTSTDCFMRQQQSKNQYRLNGSSQPVLTNGRMSDYPIQHQSKGANATTLGGYINHDLFDDETDLNKPTTSNYSNASGQLNNNWMNNLPSQHHNNPHLYPTSSQQHYNQRNNNVGNNNHNNLLKNNHPSKKDEVARAANRLSSDTDNETDRLLGTQRNDHLKIATNDANGISSADSHPVSNSLKQNANSKEVLIEGVLFNVKYLGSTHSDCEGRSDKEDRILQAETAVQEVKFRNGLSPDSQPSTEVQLFISTEKIMVLDDKHRKIMMDHSLRTISYIADIGDAIVLIVRKKNNPNETMNEMGRPISKISCHVFESSESHTITKSISQAFQVAYTELLKANGGDPNSYLPKELDYQEVLNSQEMSTDELEMFARKENQREVIVPKKEGEIIGFSIVESGWGSVLPTVVIASLKHDGPAYRCKKLFIGDQILSINGVSLVGLPLAECQQILSKIKNQRVARLSVVPCSLVVEVKIKRPDVKYQLGFSVQNGVICSLLRGGIAERGGVRVGHRIISINGTAVVGVPHEKIVTLLASSVGEIRMKTCLTSLYRQILGEENPIYY